MAASEGDPHVPPRDETTRAVKALALGVLLGLALVALARRARRSTG